MKALTPGGRSGSESTTPVKRILRPIACFGQRVGQQRGAPPTGIAGASGAKASTNNSGALKGDSNAGRRRDCMAHSPAITPRSTRQAQPHGHPGISGKNWQASTPDAKAISSAGTPGSLTQRLASESTPSCKRMVRSSCAANPGSCDTSTKATPDCTLEVFGRA